MFKLRSLLVVLLPLSLLACAGHGGKHDDDKPEFVAPDNVDKMTSTATKDGRPAWMPPPLFSMDAGSRVGIMTVLDADIQRVEGSDSESLRPNFDMATYVAGALRKSLFAKTPYGAVLIPPSARLMANKAVWQKSWNEKTKTFDDNWQKEFDAIIKQNGLAMLIIVSAPKMDDNDKLLGSGYISRSSLKNHPPAAFTSLRFFRIRGVPGRLLKPVQAKDEPEYLALPTFPKDAPKPFPRPMQDAVEQGLRNLVDKKIDTFVTMMK